MSRFGVTSSTVRKFEVSTVAALSAAGSFFGLGGQAQAERANQRNPGLSAPAGHTALLGYDISQPQGDQTLPKNAAFAIVGINYPYPNTKNKYFAGQYKQALATKGGTDLPKAAAYVLSANPGDVLDQGVTDWPKIGQSKFGVCNGTDSVACGALYGIDKAKQDIEWASPDKLKNVWIDFEPKVYSWTDSTAKNAATLEGMVSEFESQGIDVGLYFQNSELTPVIGTIKPVSDLYKLPEWLLGATSLNGQFSAEANCALSSVTGGRVEMAQIAGPNIDQDIACSS